jgi:hypothetical protein
MAITEIASAALATHRNRFEEVTSGAPWDGAANIFAFAVGVRPRMDFLRLGRKNRTASARGRG